MWSEERWQNSWRWRCGWVWVSLDGVDGDEGRRQIQLVWWQCDQHQVREKVRYKYRINIFIIQVDCHRSTLSLGFIRSIIFTKQEPCSATSGECYFVSRFPWLDSRGHSSRSKVCSDNGENCNIGILYLGYSKRPTSSLNQTMEILRWCKWREQLTQGRWWWVISNLSIWSFK